MRRAPLSVPAEGEVLAGKYRVERVLGVGGMGIVVAARHTHLNDRVALKFLLPEIAQTPALVTRFVREAQAAARIKSEHVARVYDVGTMENGVPYMVMEHLVGRDLGSLLGERGALPIGDAVDYVLQASEAIAEAHSIGLVHRDLKPANLFISQRADGSPLVKVLDFGISKAVAGFDVYPGAARQDLTATSSMMGSPLYMAPEQVRSAKTVDARADVWSLGVILHELLTGSPPFRGDTMPAVLASIVADPPASLRASRPAVPPSLESVVLACLEKDPNRRLPDVAALAEALAPFAEARSYLSIDRVAKILGRAPGRSSSPAALRGTAPAVTNTAAPWGRTADAQKPPRRGARALVAGIVVVGAIAASGGLFFTLRARAMRTAMDVRASVSATSVRATNESDGVSGLPVAPVAPSPKASASPVVAPTSAPTNAPTSALPAAAADSARAVAPRESAARDAGVASPAARRPRGAASPAPHDDLGGLIEDRH
jgi:tRNA A-37 threonylcarbamoyl transferase component Bud32